MPAKSVYGPSDAEAGVPSWSARNLVDEANPLGDELRAEMAKTRRAVSWSDPTLERIVRLRMVSDYGFPLWDVSYCVGRLRSGELVDVRLPFSQLAKRLWKSEIVDYAKADGINAKRLGVFDAVSSLQ